MKKIISIISISLLFMTTSGHAQDCETRPVDANCSFYSECLEDSFNCQETDYQYPIEYGDRFCRSFQDTRDELTVPGQLWIDRTMVCLQQFLFDKFLVDAIFSFEVEENICRKVTNAAFGSHHLCYVKPTGNYSEGVCPLWRDYKVIFEIGRPWEAIGTLHSAAVTKQVAETAQTCISYWLKMKSKKSLRPQIPIDKIIKQLRSVIQSN
ncbi:MAG: hypothetical protein KAG61_08530 [Bacteriovoracaceae bacterium]|nr:hypothetical protein [Bacteriovoracaceae bacterium]